MVRISDDYVSKGASSAPEYLIPLPALAALLEHCDMIEGNGVTYRVGPRSTERYGSYQPEPVSVSRISDGMFGMKRFHVSRKDSVTGDVIWAMVFGKPDAGTDEGELLPFYLRTDEGGHASELFSFHPIYERPIIKSIGRISKMAIEIDVLICEEGFLSSLT